MAARVMAGMFLLEQDKPGFPGVGFDSWDMYDPIKVSVSNHIPSFPPFSPGFWLLVIDVISGSMLTTTPIE
jgi:hypothetical protein